MRSVWQRVDDPTYYTSLLCMIGQFSAALIAAPAGLLSDRYGRKPLVYASCTLMAIVFVGFSLSPTIHGVLILGVGYGIGNGAQTMPPSGRGRQPRHSAPRMPSHGRSAATAPFGRAANAVAPVPTPGPCSHAP